jgi:hypothetical protein
VGLSDLGEYMLSWLVVVVIVVIVVVVVVLVGLDASIAQPGWVGGGGGGCERLQGIDGRSLISSPIFGAIPLMNLSHKD